MTGYPRRRFLTILAALPLALSAKGNAAAPPAPRTWRGIALGAEASLTLYHPDAAEAEAVIAECVAELRRLESILSLYEPGSALDALNRAGTLDHAPTELLAVLAEAKAYGALSGGAFDVTVQPLWRLYASHFATPDAAPAGPTPDAVAAARRLVNHRTIRLESDSVRLAPGQAVTLNGIAQGWITDRVADMLKARGFDHVLLDLGESRALGGHTDGRPWRVGVPDPTAPEKLKLAFDLKDRAAATSGSYGTVFDGAGRFGHIFDPETGAPARVWASVTVLADTAAKADALSTALAVVPRQQAASLLAKAGHAEAILIDDLGRVTRV